MDQQESVASLLARTFVVRRDIKAVQDAAGVWRPHRKLRSDEHLPWTRDAFQAHVDGTSTFGHYMVSVDGKVKLFAFDIDLNKTGHFVDMEHGDATRHPCNPREVWLDRTHPGFPYLKVQLRTVADLLAYRVRDLLDIPVAVAYSGGKGVHVYGLCGPIDAADARAAAHEVLSTPASPGGGASFELFRGRNFWQATGGALPNISVETFPKQDDLEAKSHGNLMKLPLGINRKTGQKSFFLDMASGYDTFKPLDPYVALAGQLP